METLSVQGLDDETQVRKTQISRVVHPKRQTKLAVFQVSLPAVNNPSEWDNLPTNTGSGTHGHPFPILVDTLVNKKTMPPAGLEPATPQFSVECSTRLS